MLPYVLPVGDEKPSRALVSDRSMSNPVPVMAQAPSGTKADHGAPVVAAVETDAEHAAKVQAALDALNAALKGHKAAFGVATGGPATGLVSDRGDGH